MGGGGYPPWNYNLPLLNPNVAKSASYKKNKDLVRQ